MGPETKITTALLEDKHIILESSSGSVLATNATGALILELYRQEPEAEKAARHIARRFDIPFRQALRDVDDFLNAFKRSLLAPLKKRQSRIPEGKTGNKRMEPLPPPSCSYFLAGRRVTLRCKSSSFKRALAGALGHLEDNNRSPGTRSVSVW